MSQRQSFPERGKTPVPTLNQTATAKHNLVRAALAITLALQWGCCAPVSRPHHSETLRIAGTFTNLHKVQDVGLFGCELRVIPTNWPYYHVLAQFGQCEFLPESARGTTACFLESDLVLVAANTESRARRQALGAIDFTIPGSAPYSGNFEGTVEQDQLVGTFKFTSGKVMQVRLRRGASYWETD